MDPCYCVKCNAQFDKFKAEVERLEKLHKDQGLALVNYREALKAEINIAASLREGLEGAREIFYNGERMSRKLGNELVAEAMAIGLCGCDKALKGDSSEQD